ncbi:MAG: hypothetical protein IKJ39_00090 [Lachnospiraceae bacterium]|nr:hypothetical protein [Lachnospiraceae bacterium]
MVKTKNELKKASDKYLLEIYEEAKEHPEDFETFYCTDYAYREIESELESRGYQLKWVKEAEEEYEK